MSRLDPSFWAGRRIFLTGHTGFKGSWLAFWLTRLGAQVTGYSLAPPTRPALFDMLRLDEAMDHHIGNIRDRAALESALLNSAPDLVMHLAAQPIVSLGYREPMETFETNVMGTVHLLEACRRLNRDVPILIVSSDKCYHNDGKGRAFAVGDALGGSDPYSASKAGTEIVTNAYTASYFSGEQRPIVASARAGNVVGGGDWALDRLLPDCARAFADGKPVVLRNPCATRPWQHVLEALFGYLMLVERLPTDRSLARAWNFGPPDNEVFDVGTVAGLFRDAWGDGARIKLAAQEQTWQEAATLVLDCTETRELLDWAPVLDIRDTVTMTAQWYKAAAESSDTTSIRRLTAKQIEDYEERQANRG